MLCYRKYPRWGLDFPHFAYTDGLDSSGNFMSAAATLFLMAAVRSFFAVVSTDSILGGSAAGSSWKAEAAPHRSSISEKSRLVVVCGHGHEGVHVMKMSLIVGITASLFGYKVAAQDAMTLYVSPETAACLVENKGSYLGVSQPVLFFFLSLCPDPLGDELGALVENSGGPSGETMERIMMLKSDFECMLERIETQMSQEDAVTEDTVLTLVLDCA